MIVMRSNEPWDDYSQWEWYKKYNNYNMPTLFLAGPNPRKDSVPSWRPESLDILKEIEFEGGVFVPEPFAKDYETQVQWEWNALTFCTLVLFWVPRDLHRMPAFTTNVEFGMFVESDKIVYGRPEGAPKTRYLDWHYRRGGFSKDKKWTGKRAPFSDLRSMLIHAATLAKFKEDSQCR